MRHTAASLGVRLASVACCPELQPAALTRALRAAAATGSWLLLEGVEQLGPAALQLLAGHLSTLREAASEEGVEDVLTLEGPCLAPITCTPCLSAGMLGCPRSGGELLGCWMALRVSHTHPGLGLPPPVQMGQGP